METFRQIPNLKLQPFFVVPGLATEKGQAVVRIFWPVVFMAYLAFNWMQFAGTAQYYAAWALSGVHFAFAVAMLIWVRKRSGDNFVRRVVPVITDQVLFATTLFVTEEIAAPFVLMPLFFTFGSGLRYGRTYAVVSSALSSLLTCAVLLLSPYWAQYPTVRIGLALATLYLPVYVFRLTDALSQDLRTDSLTKLKNRIGFEELLKETCRNTAQAQYDSAVVVVDLDGFKRINDEQSHATGNEVLKHVGYWLQVELSPVGTPARYGGDEFTVLATKLKSRTTLEAALTRFLERTVAVGGLFESPLSASIGVYYIEPTASVTPEFAFKAADKLMYRAKQLGKNQFVTSVGYSFTKDGDLVEQCSKASAMPAKAPSAAAVSRHTSERLDELVRSQL
jgi:diguanylate cyclase (GGDEF)-like protein